MNPSIVCHKITDSKSDVTEKTFWVTPILFPQCEKRNNGFGLTLPQRSFQNQSSICRDVLMPHLGRAVSAVDNEKHVELPHKSVLKEMQFVEKNNLWEISDYRSYSDSSLGVFMQTCMSTPYRHMQKRVRVDNTHEV